MVFIFCLTSTPLLQIDVDIPFRIQPDNLPHIILYKRNERYVILLCLRKSRSDKKLVFGLLDVKTAIRSRLGWIQNLKPLFTAFDLAFAPAHHHIPALRAYMEEHLISCHFFHLLTADLLFL